MTHLEPCPFEARLTLDRTTKTWGLGRCCLGCGLPVRVVVEHYNPQVTPTRNMLAEAFIRGVEAGADRPELAGDGDAMYAAFRSWQAQENVSSNEYAICPTGEHSDGCDPADHLGFTIQR